MSQSVWFKRNLYTQHDLIFLKKQEIKEVHESNKSETIFYIFVEEFFTSIKDEAELHELVTHLEANYLQMPQHLKGKIFLYRNLFRYFDSGSQTLPGIRQLHEFLRLKDYEVFKALFDREKTRKGCLLKEAKKIYEETCPTGAAIYN